MNKFYNIRSNCSNKMDFNLLLQFQYLLLFPMRGLDY